MLPYSSPTLRYSTNYLATYLLTYLLTYLPTYPQQPATPNTTLLLSYLLLYYCSYLVVHVAPCDPRRTSRTTSRYHPHADPAGTPSCTHATRDGRYDDLRYDPRDQKHVLQPTNRVHPTTQVVIDVTTNTIHQCSQMRITEILVHRC